MKYIKDLKEGESVREIYLCRQFQQLKTKTDKEYYSLQLQDKTGTLDAKVWDTTSPGIRHFEEKNFVHVEGRVTSFQSNLQLNITQIYPCKEGEYTPEDYLPVSGKDLDAVMQELLRILDRVENPFLSRLANHFFREDEAFLARFRKSSAAKNVHHAYVGGLLEHTVSVAQFCEFLLQQYPQLNRDLLLSAALFHDIGKTEEISLFPDNDYTDAGNLLGHIFIGAEMLRMQIATIPNFPKGVEQQLLHCILSHHGEMEFGSPKKPALLEALALHIADNGDAKMETMGALLRGGDEMETWMGYQRLFESNVRRTTGLS